MDLEPWELNRMKLSSLLIVYSYHHENTLKIARAIARILDAEIRKPDQVGVDDLNKYDLIGFGSGIYSARHHDSILELAKKLPKTSKGKAFLFSTTGAPKIAFNEEFVAENHKSLRDILESRGYTIVNEFSSLGHNTNSFLRFTGGLNKGRPNTEDLKRAEEFAMKLKKEALK